MGRPERLSDLLPAVVAGLVATHTTVNGEPPMTEHDDRFEPCLGCSKPLDVTAPHISFERRREVQDPPGHVVEIGGAVGVVFHVECAPSLDALAGGAA